MVWTHTDCEFAYAYYIEHLLLPGLNTAVSAPPVINASAFDAQYKYVQPSYEPGVRVHGRYDSGCRYLELSYLWVEIEDSATARTRGPFLGVGEPDTFLTVYFASIGFGADSLRGKINSRYQNVNLEGGAVISSGCWGSFGAYTNLRWVDIDHTRSSLGVLGPAFGPEPPLGPNYPLTWTNKFWGFGLGFGLNGDISVGCGFGLQGHVGITGLLGETSTGMKGITLAELPFLPVIKPADVFTPARTCFVPGLDIGLGLGYDWCCSCVRVNVALAYEIQYYPHALSYRGTIDLPKGQSDLSVIGNIGYGGPSLRLSVGY